MKYDFVVLLFLAFVVMKLCDVIHWSWVWVTCPLWLGLGVIWGVGIFVFLGLLLDAAAEAIRNLFFRRR